MTANIHSVVNTLYASTDKNPNMRCTLSVSSRFSTNLGPQSPLHPDTAAYAARRTIAHSRRMHNWLVPRSYQLRLAKGKARRAQLLWVQMDCRSFGLPAGSADVYVRLSVDAAGVAVERVELAAPHARVHFRPDAVLGYAGSALTLL